MNIEKLKVILRTNAEHPKFMDNSYIYFGTLNIPIADQEVISIYIDRTTFYVRRVAVGRRGRYFDKSDAGVEECLIHIERLANRLLKSMKKNGASQALLARTDFFTVE